MIPPALSHLRDLSALDLSGVGGIYAGAIDTDRLDLNITGAGEVIVRALDAETLMVEHTGVGKCELAVLPPRDFYEVVSGNPELWTAMRTMADARRLANAQILAGHTGVV